MPYVPVNGDILRVTIAATYPDGQVQENNLNYVVTSAGGTDPRPTLGPAIYALFIANWLNFVPSTANMYGFKVSIVNRTPPPRAYSVVATNVGGDIHVTLPTQDRPIMSFRTDKGGPGYRGRLYMFTPTASSMTTSGFLDPTPAAAIAALAAALLPPITSGGTTLSLVIAHRHKGPPVSWTWDLVTGASVPVKYATQRKSGNYGRLNTAPW